MRQTSVKDTSWSTAPSGLVTSTVVGAAIGTSGAAPDCAARHVVHDQCAHPGRHDDRAEVRHHGPLPAESALEADRCSDQRTADDDEQQRSDGHGDSSEHVDQPAR